MTFQSDYALRDKDLADFGLQRARDAAFDAIQALWRRRKAGGMKQKDLAARIGRDPGWVSTALRGPGNWTMRTFGELAVGLGGEVEISVHALEDAIETPTNYNAYDGYRAHERDFQIAPTKTDSAVVVFKFERQHA
jgi:transcriptional regulator with XRE-family HTH domain